MNVWDLYSVLWTIFAVVWIAGLLRTKRTQERAPLGSRLAYGIPVLLGGYFMFSDSLPLASLYLRVVSENTFVESLALFLTATGIAFAIWARFYIGQNWSGAVTIKVGHQLVRGGPYRWVRHPIYSGILLALFGTALARRQVIGFVAVMLFCMGFWLKIRLEEQFMRKTFGEQYIEYSRSTGTLVPRFHSSH
jgi:protein-S-isoprenylcysteine O-methyltransferase Ste14